jgi:nicotinate phosphoribosyltransferase
VAGGLLTDLYELNMAASYLRRAMTGEATFSLFARRLPPGRGFLIAAGLEDCLAFLESFSFTGDDLAYLRRTQDYDEATLEQFARLRSPARCGRCPRAPPCSPPSRCWR